MSLKYKAAVLHAPKSPLVIETVEASELAPDDVLVRVKAVGLCHTDLEVIEGSLRNPMPILLGREAAGIVEQVGSRARGLSVGDHVVLSWNPHCVAAARSGLRPCRGPGWQVRAPSLPLTSMIQSLIWQDGLARGRAAAG